MTVSCRADVEFETAIADAMVVDPGQQNAPAASAKDSKTV
jgi:hypothetical protein